MPDSRNAASVASGQIGSERLDFPSSDCGLPHPYGGFEIGNDLHYTYVTHHESCRTEGGK
jgi:hypothetical protein